MININGMDVRFTDQSDTIDLTLLKDPMKDAVELTTGEYYRILLIPKRNILKGGNIDGFGFDIQNLK